MADYYGTTSIDIFAGVNDSVNYYYFDAGELSSLDLIIGGAGSVDVIRFEDPVVIGSATLVNKIGVDVIDMSGGDDVLFMSDSIIAYSDDPGVSFRINGMDGDDQLIASSVSAAYGVAMDGGIGNDTLTGGDGDDDLMGNTGDDFYYGSLGEDTYSGYQGWDDVVGSATELNGDTFNQIDSISVTSAGVLSITSFGIGVMALAAGSNFVTIDSVHSAQMTINGGSGADEIALIYDGSLGQSEINGNGGSDTLTGSESEDVLSGGSDADLLEGEGGDDTLDGGSGGDILIGGSGDDLYLAVESGDVVSEAFSGGTDTIETLRNATTMALNIEAMIFTGTGDFDANGNSIGNTITGGAGEDTIEGLAGNDKLIGNSGNDELYGGSGNDTLNGGGNNDFTRGGGGDDLLQTGGGNDTAYGGDQNDTIKGGPGVDALYGQGGDDIIEGGDGVDTINGGAGVDTATYFYAQAGIDADLTRSTGQVVTHAGTDELRGIENLNGTNYDDAITGNQGGNVLIGYGGADTIWGLGGDDSISATSILAEIHPGSGNDTVDGILGGEVRYDEIVEGFVAGFIAPFTMSVDGIGTGTDTILYSNKIHGGLGADTFFYFGEAHGGGGGDIFHGGNFANAFHGDGGFDTVIYDTLNSASGVTSIDMLDPAAGTGLGAGDSFSGIEAVICGDSDDTIYATDGDEYLAGGGNLDVIDGRGGNDTISGGAFTDFLYGGIGFDYADYSDSFAAVQIDLGAVGQTGGDADGDGLYDFEGVLGSAFDDMLTGSIGDNILRGLAGIDVMDGGGGADGFDFDGITDSGNSVATADTITGFGLDDVIDLSNVATGGASDVFTFVGEDAFTAIGQVRFVINAAANHTIVQVNTFGVVGPPEMMIVLDGQIALTPDQFIL
jgi:Ca2+-binding RTX toxin-like protein